MDSQRPTVALAHLVRPDNARVFPPHKLHRNLGVAIHANAIQKEAPSYFASAAFILGINGGCFEDVICLGLIGNDCDWNLFSDYGCGDRRLKAICSIDIHRRLSRGLSKCWIG
uniref:Uncharacterized protein n=1 Tax=mine drainage metagenome TaxID=410659 RepID=E6PY21_9ZZZZ